MIKKELLPPNQHVQKNIFAKISSEMEQCDLTLLSGIADIIRISALISTSFEMHFARYDMSQPGFLTIMILYSDDKYEWTALRLANALGVKPPTMTGILDTLEKKELITRHPSSEDRRVIYIKLSKKGISFSKKNLPDHIQRISSAFSSLNASYLKLMTKLFPVINNSLEKLNQ